MPGRVVCESSPQPPGQLKLRNTHWFLPHMHLMWARRYLLPHILTFKIDYYTLHCGKSNICQSYVFETVTDSKRRGGATCIRSPILKSLQNIMPQTCRSSEWGFSASLEGPGLSESVLWKVEAEILVHETDCWFQSGCTMSSSYISQNKLLKKTPTTTLCKGFLFICDSH